MSKIACVTALALAMIGCVSQARKAEHVAAEARAARQAEAEKTAREALNIALHRLEVESERIRPARQQCKAVYDDLQKAISRLPDTIAQDSRPVSDIVEWTLNEYEKAAREATSNALAIFDEIKEIGHEAITASFQYSEVIQIRIGSYDANAHWPKVSAKVEFAATRAQSAVDHCGTKYKSIQALRSGYSRGP